MPKVQKVLTLRMGPSNGAVASTLERHLDVQDLPRLLAEGWRMVETSAPDEDGIATILLEREEPSP